MSDRELNIPQLNRSSHGDPALFGYAPAPRVRDLGNQSVSMTAVEDTCDLGAFPTWIRDIFQVW